MKIRLVVVFVSGQAGMQLVSKTPRQGDIAMVGS
jgi:hypothetical protein